MAPKPNIATTATESGYNNNTANFLTFRKEATEKQPTYETNREQ